MDIGSDRRREGASTSARDFTSEARSSVERTELLEFSEDSVDISTGMQSKEKSSGIGRWRLPPDERQKFASNMQILDVDETERPSIQPASDSRHETEASQGPKWRRTMEMGQLSSSSGQQEPGDNSSMGQRLRPPPKAPTFSLSEDNVQRMGEPPDPAAACSSVRCVSEDEVQRMGQPQDPAAACSSGRSQFSQEGSHRKPSILKNSFRRSDLGSTSSKRGSVDWKIDHNILEPLRSEPTLNDPDGSSPKQEQTNLYNPPSFSNGSFRSNGSFGSKSQRASFAEHLIPEDAPISFPQEVTARATEPLYLLEPQPPNADASPQTSFVQVRNRRQSFLDYFKSGSGVPGPSEEPPPRAPPNSQDLTRQPSMDDLRASFRASKSKSLTQSFVNMFKSKGGREHEDLHEEGVPVARSRGSVIDFFKFKGRASEEGEAPQNDLRPVAKGPKARRGSMVDLIAPSRRASVMDLFSGPRKGRSNSLNRSNSLEAVRRRSSVMQRLLFGKDDEDGNDLLAADARWFTSLDDFRALTHRYHQTKFMDSYFSCAIKTGQHHVLKIYHKDKMEPSDVKNLQQVLEFAKLLDHPHLVKILGTWETEEAFHIVEEYVIRGDILQDSMSYPERYTEKFLVTKVIQPLLTVLEYLHEQQIMHRSIIPEHLLLGRDDKFFLGHFVKAVNFSITKTKEQVGMLDYMAPEMISVMDKREDAMFVSSGQLPLESDSPFGAFALTGKGSTDSGRPNSGKPNMIMVPHNPWEWQESYNEKVDIWQVGCMIHEILCGCLPFETDNHHLTAALTLWADVNFWPETLSPECISFLKACLQKNPELRPSAEELLKHPWVVKTMAGEGGEAGLPTLAQIRDAEVAAQKKPGGGVSSKGGSSLKGSQTTTSDDSGDSSDKGGWGGGVLSGMFGGWSQAASNSRRGGTEA